MFRYTGTIIRGFTEPDLTFMHSCQLSINHKSGFIIRTIIREFTKPDWTFMHSCQLSINVKSGFILPATIRGFTKPDLKFMLNFNYLCLMYKCQIWFCEFPDDGTCVPKYVGIDELLYFNIF
jgi:hypothetical protein